eukprot:5657427-Pyramimonas_sp.AAC.1
MFRGALEPSVFSLQFLSAALQAVCSIAPTSDLEAQLAALPASSKRPCRSSPSGALVPSHSGWSADVRAAAAVSQRGGFAQDDVPEEELREQRVAQDATIFELRAGKPKLAKRVRTLAATRGGPQLALHEEDDEIDLLRAMLNFRNGKRLVS